MGGNRRTTRRGVALAVALAVHVLLLWIALYIEHRQSLQPEASAPLVVMSISLPPDIPAPAVIPPAPAPRSASPPPLQVPEPLVTPPEEPRTGAITLPPGSGVDWYREAEITVRALPAPEEGPKERSLDSDAKGMEIPNVTRTPRAGDSWIQPDGTIVVLTTVVGDTGVFCKSGPPLLMDHFEIWQRTMPVKCGARSIRKRAPFTLEKREEDDAQSALP